MNFVEVLRVLMKNGYRPRRTLEFVGWAAEEVGLRGSNEMAQTYAAQGKNVVAVYQNEMSGYNAGPATRLIVLLQDYVDTDLQNFNEQLVNEYCLIPPKRSICGYGCSDHAPWTNRGFSAVWCVAVPPSPLLSSSLSLPLSLLTPNTSPNPSPPTRSPRASPALLSPLTPPPPSQNKITIYRSTAEAGPYDSGLNPNYHTARDTVDKLDFSYSIEFAKLALSFVLEIDQMA